VVFEDESRLCVLIEWYVRAVLEPVGPGEFRSPTARCTRATACASSATATR
jgi:hypothetical protein